jgi:membrane complex biogenesis BtpA family protein
VILENYRDVPFHPGRVPASTIAAMTQLVCLVRREYPRLVVGANVLRNDATAALAIAHATGANFIRVNVHTGAVVTDQGLLQGMAHDTLRYRRELKADVGILADLQVKHGRPLAIRPLVEEAMEARERGLADGLILTGPVTGAAADPDDLRTVRAALPDCPLLVGSGVTPGNIEQFAPLADGYIVGTYFGRNRSDRTADIAPNKVADLIAALPPVDPQQRKER